MFTIQPRIFILFLLYLVGIFFFLSCESKTIISPQSLTSKQRQSETNNPPPELPYKTSIGPQKNQRELGILVGGDIMLDWGIREVMQKYGSAYPGLYIKPLIQSFDFALANLETPVAKPCDIVRNKLYTFQAQPEQLALLHFLNIKGVFLANNHIGDCGPNGMKQTLIHLTRQNIAHGGVGPLTPTSKRNHLHLPIGQDRLTVLVYGSKTIAKDRASQNTPGAYYPDRKIIQQDIRYWRGKSEYLIVSIHWGTEYYDRPLPKQKKLARFIIDQGGDAVLGHHSHWVQGIERYKSGIILYSLGNFIFGSNNKFLRSGYTAGFIFRDKKIHRVEIYPINTTNKGDSRFQPRLLTGSQSQKVLRHVKKLSRELKTPLQIQGDIGLILLNQNKEYYRVNHKFRWRMEQLTKKNKKLKLQ